MTALWTSSPLLLVLLLMLWLRWSSARAGAAGLLLCILVGWCRYALAWDVLWVSQARGAMLALFVLYIIWPALLVYNVVLEVGGMALLERWLASRVGDQRACGLLLAWALSGVLEGIAGFGVPLAVVSPMLVNLGFAPILAVVATAVGHSWSVTFGDMGVVFEALVAVVGLPGDALALPASAVLGLACLASGLGVASMLGLHRRWPQVVAAGLAMAVTQALMASSGLRPLAALAAGVAGLTAGVVLFGSRAAPRSEAGAWGAMVRLSPYLLTALLLALLAFLPGLRDRLAELRTVVALPTVITSTGHVTAGGEAKSIQWLTHPGSAMLASLVIACLLLRRRALLGEAGMMAAVRQTVAAAAPASLGVVAMMGLAMLMDHTGMTLSLARAVSEAVGGVYPLLAGGVGILGAFTTGSNTNSNVLFGPLKLEMSRILGSSAVWLLAAQTAGGALGSMVAPAKLVVGCATVGLAGREGLVLRRTVPYAAAIGTLVGLITWALA